MTEQTTAFVGADIFDGTDMLTGHALLVQAGEIRGLVPWRDMAEGAALVELDGGVIAPGFVDLQVNGGGGLMLNDAQTVGTLATMAAAHARLGATAILPTLITDTAERTQAAVDAVAEAVANGVSGIAGLHLEGPHLSQARKGAHDPSLVRPMEDTDLRVLTEAAVRLPCLLLTVAPESVTPDQINALKSAGAIVSIGHTDSPMATCIKAADAGASCVTHLFNAMSQLGNREPGTVGAALSDGRLSAGLIADLVHVHPATIAAALRAKNGPGRIFLITDAMAPAGSDIQDFVLNGRRIERRNGQLTLSNGTLAGADLDLATAIRNLVSVVGVPLETALTMATSIPSAVAGLTETHGHFLAGRRADIVHLTSDLLLDGVWVDGQALPSKAGND